MTALIAMDTETCGLSWDTDVWEFAAIRREPDGTETRHHLFIEHDPAKCSELPQSFRSDHVARYNPDLAVTQREAAESIHDLFKDRPHIIGAVPNFDTERLALLLRRFGFEPGHHYHLVDAETLAIGFLSARARNHPYGRERAFLAKGLPWDSDELTAALGLEVPPAGVRHTAMGDAVWAMSLFDAVMGNPR